MTFSPRHFLGSALNWLPEPISVRLRGPEYRYRVSDVPPPPVAPLTPVRLFIGPANFAAQGYRIARSAERLPGVGAVSMQFRNDRDYGFPSDNAVPVRVYRFSRRWQRRQFEAVASGFTHIAYETGRPLFGTLFDADPAREIAELRRRGVKIAMVAYGSDIRSPARHKRIDRWSPFNEESWDRIPELEAKAVRYAKLLEEVDAPVFVATPDMLLDWPGSRWLPIVIDPAEWETDTTPLVRERPLVVHAPTNAVVKGSDHIEPAMRRLHDEGLIEYRRIEGVPSTQMPALYQDADVVIDQFRIGTYATAAIETMAAGRIVIAHVHEQVREHVRREYGREIPVVQATMESVEDVVREIVADRQRFRAVAASGPGFVRGLHDGTATAEVLASFLVDDHTVSA